MCGLWTPERKATGSPEVKTCRSLVNGRFHVMVCTKGGNQSWNGVGQAVLGHAVRVAVRPRRDGRRWFVPAREVGGGSAILLGGPKDAAYEVESGRPLAAASVPPR